MKGRMQKIQPRVRIAAVAMSLVAISACSPITRTSGYFPDAELVEKVRPGVHDKDSIATLLGSPTSVADFNGETWYYVYRKSERIAVFEEKITEQRVLAVQFDDIGVVSGIERYDLEDARTIVAVERVTPTRGKEFTLLEQLFGNFGRFSNKEGAKPAR